MERQGPGEAELRALIAVAGAVSTAHRLEEVLEVVAEETHRVTGAAIVSISRWEREHHRLRCLINVGDLRGRWDRFPADEVYPLDVYPMAEPLLQEGTPYVVERADVSLPATDRQLLEDLEMEVCVGVPVVVEGRIWGLLDVFGDATARAAQRSRAGRRPVLCAHVSALAFTDALTGLANRRALDERMESAIGRRVAAAVAFCDLDGLKQINDAAGHEAGDAALRRAAEALRAAAGGHAGSFVGRIGGDEFCIVLEGAPAAAVGAIAEEACRALAPHQLTFSCGVAALQPGDRPADVFRAADAAQYAAKRAGRGLVVIAGGGGAPDWTPSPGRRAQRDRTPDETHALAAALIATVDRAPEGERVERLAHALHRLT